MKKQNLIKGKTVKLRKKAISSGYSLYLEYANNYRQEKIYLRIHLSKGDTPLRRKNDTDTWNKAEEIRQAIEDFIIKNKAQTLEFAYKLYVDSVNQETEEEAKKNLTLVEYLQAFKEEKARTGQSKSLAVTINNLIKYVTDFTDGEKMLLTDVSKEWLEEFLMYLGKTNSFVRNRFKKGSNVENVTSNEKTNKPLAKSTAKLYYNTFVCALGAAESDGLIISPARRVKAEDKKVLKGDGTQREFLTAEELGRMEATLMRNEETKRAFLFSCFCGLRISDVKSLTYGDIKQEQAATGQRIYIVRKTMVKTRRVVSVPLSKKALSYLPADFSQKSKETKVFNLPTVGAVNDSLKTWARDAGVDKVVTFHTSRHTFATLALTLGVDVFTTSKLLGHQNVRTTQIYAEVIDAKKEQAISLFDTL